MLTSCACALSIYPVRTKERAEEDLAATAHQTFEHAVEEERVLKEAIEEEDLMKENVPADDYIAERLHMAQETEKASHDEEFEHLGKWAELRMDEEEIKSTLKELKELDEEIDPGDRLHLVWDARLNMFVAHKTHEQL